MPTKKTVKEEVKKEVKKKDPEVTQQQLNAIWDVVEELQDNLEYVNEKLQRCQSRLGIE
tara:strand:+ start:408 stop:584 length:177 start_codon:yes stop_codon:yes gene_type:complete